MPKLELKLLGFPQLLWNGRRIELPLRKAVALLVYLAEARVPIGRETAATLLWPEADEVIAKARLRRTLYRIRSGVRADLIESDREKLWIASGLTLTVDAQDFERTCDDGAFADAASLYKDDYLAGFVLQDCAEFEEWVFYRREALRSRRIQALERLVEDSIAQGHYREAISAATDLVALDPFSESAHRHLISAQLRAGEGGAAKRQYEACVRILRDELGVEPDPQTTQLLALPTPVPVDVASTPRRPATRYAESGGVHIAYQAVGSGPLDIVLVPGFVSHVERAWEDARCRSFLLALAEMGRLIIFDRRGIGLSDRIGAIPTVEATAQDIAAVMDAAESRKALLIGASEGGPGCVRFAADAPQRLAGLVLYGSLAKGTREKGYPFALSRKQYDDWLKRLIGEWGGPAEIEFFAPSFAGDRQAESWWAGLLRSASSPGAIKGVLEALRDVDVRSLLPKIETPTLVIHRRRDRAVRSEAGQYLARAIASARYVELEGQDHWFWAGDQQRLLLEIKKFVAQLEN